MAEPWSSRVSSTIDMAASPTGSAHWIVQPASVTVGLRDLASLIATTSARRGAGEDGEPGAAGAEAGAQRHPAGHRRRHDPVGPLAAPPPGARRLGGGDRRGAAVDDGGGERPDDDGRPTPRGTRGSRAGRGGRRCRRRPRSGVEPLAALGARRPRPVADAAWPPAPRPPWATGLRRAGAGAWRVGHQPRLPTPAAARPPRRRRPRAGRARTARRCTRWRSARGGR